MDLNYLSLNQATTNRWSVQETVDGCSRHGISWIGLWRHKIAQAGVRESVRAVREAGLRVSSLCRGGMFPADSASERAKRIDENRRAIDEAAALGTNVLVLVCGPAENCSLADARKMVEYGIAELIPYAAQRGVKLGVEPLHPMFAGDRSVIVSLSQTNDLIERLASDQVGVVIDVYHVWWDPKLYVEISRSSDHILGFHINDCLTPIKDALMSRGMMGDGCIELKEIYEAVVSAGYKGPIEVEIFNQKIWNLPGDDVLSLIKGRLQEQGDENEI